MASPSRCVGGGDAPRSTGGDGAERRGRVCVGRGGVRGASRIEAHLSARKKHGKGGTRGIARQRTDGSEKKFVAPSGGLTLSF